MTRVSGKRFISSAVLAAALAVSAAAPAFADGRWEHRGGWGGGHERHDWGGGRGGPGIGGALLGLGVGVAIGSAIAAPPAYYAPPPAVYYGY